MVFITHRLILQNIHRPIATTCKTNPLRLLKRLINSKCTKEISNSAEDVYAISRKIINEQKILHREGLSHNIHDRSSSNPIALKIASLLSPSARRELSEARQHVDLCFDDSSPTTTSKKPQPPTRIQLRQVAINQAVPFIGFGLMDNAILILAGDAIDTTLGVVLGISTLCAAAIGNIVSDVAGVLLGTAIEDVSSKFGLPIPKLTHAQRQLRSVRFAGQFGCAVGLTIGCIVGMFPLLLIDSGKAEKLKREALLDQIFRDVVAEAKNLVHAETTCLFMVMDGHPQQTKTPFVPSSISSTHHSSKDSTPKQKQRQHHHLWGKYVDGNFSQQKHLRVPIERGNSIISRVALSGEPVNAPDVKAEPDFAGDSIYGTRPNEIKNMIAVPVLDAQRNVVAVIQAVNKTTHTNGFTLQDVQILQAMASHVSVSLQSVHQEEDAKLGLKETIKIFKEHKEVGESIE